MIIEWPEFRKMALQLVEIGYIPIFEEMDDKLAEIVPECIFWAKLHKKNKVTLLINSGGGWNSCLGAMKGAMFETGLQFTGLVMGVAYSNAFHLLQLCQKRIAVTDALLMFHWGQQRLGNQLLSAFIDGATWPVEHIVNVEISAAQYVSKRTGIPVDQLKIFAHQERIFSAEEALQINFVDQVIDGLPKNVQQALKKKR